MFTSKAVKPRFDNCQNLSYMRLKSEFLTISELYNRLVLTFLEQIYFPLQADVGNLYTFLSGR
jgi:hypothetical protein